MTSLQHCEIYAMLSNLNSMGRRSLLDNVCVHVVCNLRAGDSLAKMATGKDGYLRPNWSIIMNLCLVISKMHPCGAT